MKVETNRITLPRGARVPEVGSFVGQLDALSSYMLRDLRGITRAELAWQPKRGQSTIGMLLLHVAIVEVYWILIAQERFTEATFQRTFGGTMMDDGMPLADRGVAPAALRGKTLAYYTRALKRARTFLRRETAKLGRADLDRDILRTRRNGQLVRQNVRWILFHLVEHLGGHYGQILMLRHQYRDRRRA
jgi:uncharacterized damage-inducible protein DinB